MAERKLSAPVRATYDEDLTTAGSWKIDEDGDFIYRCPCGCGSKGTLIVGVKKKPDITPSWEWNGDKDAPTLRPSINHIGHWHGFLGGAHGDRPGWWIDA